MTEVKYNENRFVIVSKSKNVTSPQKQIQSHLIAILHLSLKKTFRTITDTDMMKNKIPDLENDQNRWISSQLPHSKGVRRGPCLVDKLPENAHKLLLVVLKCGLQWN